MARDEEAVALLPNGQLAGEEEEYEMEAAEKQAQPNGNASNPASSFDNAGSSASPQHHIARSIAYLKSPSLPSRASLARLGFFLVPSFIQTRLRPESARPNKPLRPTAYLDGMRGVASLLVAFCHLSYGPYDIIHGWGFATMKPGEYNTFLRLPIVRLLYSGTAMVIVFFIVSGYALSYKPLKQMRAGQYSDFNDTLTSATFRRGFRLFLPCLASTLFAAMLAQLGLYEGTRAIAQNEKMMIGHREVHASQRSSIFAQLHHWANTNYLYFEPFIWDSAHEWPDYDEHLWTIPVEFRASLLLFVAHLAVAKMSPLLRQLTVAALIVIAPFKSCWPMMLFYGGLLFAEFDLAMHEKAASSGLAADTRPPTRNPAKLLWPFLWTLGSIFGLFLMSQPWESARTYFWVRLTASAPSGITGKSLFLFWPCVGGLIFVFSVGRATHLQRLFDNRIAQYLGRISFALYLMQSWVIHIVGYGCFGLFWSMFGTHPAGKAWGFTCSGVVVVVVLVWAADVFTRAVDEPSIEFARWLEKKVMRGGRVT